MNCFTKNTLRFKVGMCLPMWFPIGVTQCRVGDNTTDYFRFYRPTKWVW